MWHLFLAVFPSGTLMMKMCLSPTPSGMRWANHFPEDVTSYSVAMLQNSASAGTLSASKTMPFGLSVILMVPEKVFVYY